MSTATIDSPNDTTTTRRAPNSRPRAVQDRSRRELTEARQHTELAVTDLIAGATDALRTLLPTAVLRPTEAVDTTFDMAEQLLAGARRVCFEVAAVIESGLQGAERRAA